MPRRFSPLVSLLAVCFAWEPSFAPAQELSKEEQDAGFVALFNGKDFANWRFDEESPPTKIPDNWKVEGGVIKLSGGGKPYLASAKEHANFELRLEWRGLKEKYNSGLFIRSGKNVGSNQINLAHKSEGAFLGGKVTGAKAVGDLQKPASEWNEWRVIADGEKVTFWCNGKQAWEATGLKPEKGYIGLQAEGAAMEFRNIRIREIAAGENQAAAKSHKQPNILLIYTDDQSYKTVGCYPEALPGVTTPHIDALARRGIRFDGCFLGAWCMPSRASLLTGRLPHGIESMRMAAPYPSSSYDPEQCPFWPKVFRERGYVTAQIGKWHTGVDAGTGRDWDWQIVWNRPKHPENAGHYYDQQLLSFNGEEKLVDGYSTDNYTKWACEFIRGEHRDATRPWFLWLCYGGVHGPTTPAERHKGLHKSDPVNVPKDIFSPRPGKPDYLDKTQAWSRGKGGEPIAGKSGEKFGDESGKTQKTYADFVHQVNDCVQSLDEGVGELIATLQATGQLENTLVVFTADQGFGMGEHGFRTKLGPYDATYRSPLIISQPGTLPEGQVCPHCVTGVDLAVTFFARAGLDLPWKMHGHDLSPLLTNPDAAWPHAAFYEFTGDDYGSDVTKIVTETPKDAAYNNVPWYIALRLGRWKYIRYLTPGETEELYDLKADPEELSNLADQPEQRETLVSLRKQALAELTRTEAPFVEKLPGTRQMQSSSEPRP